jgi:hypothetical protein
LFLIAGFSRATYSSQQQAQKTKVDRYHKNIKENNCTPGEIQTSLEILVISSSIEFTYCLVFNKVFVAMKYKLP